MRQLPLYRGYRDNKELVAYSLVDDEDFDILNQFSWHHSPDSKSRGPGYARRGTKANGIKADIKLHRFIMGLVAGDGLEVDHINRNTLDNRKINLRVVTRIQQMQNVTPREGAASKFRGVAYDKSSGKPWRARARLNNKVYNIGRYHTEEEAAVAALRFRNENMQFAED